MHTPISFQTAAFRLATLVLLTQLFPLTPVATAASARFWISASGTMTNGPEALTLNLPIGTTRTIFVWAQPETDGAGDYKNLNNLSLNLVSDAPLFDIRDNFQVNEGSGDRFELIRDSDSIDFPITSGKTQQEVASGQADSVSALSAGIALTDDFSGIGSIQPDNDCTGSSSCGSSWLIARFDLYGVASLGIGNIRLQVGELGMNHAFERSEDTQVIFGAGANDPVYNAKNHRSITLGGDTPDLIINAVPFLPGDYNQNGIVDAADYAVYRNTLGQAGSGLAADGNASGHVDSGDYTVWKSHFGRTAGSGAHVTTNAAVPEPTTSFVHLLAIVAMSPFRRSRIRNTY